MRTEAPGPGSHSTSQGWTGGSCPTTEARRQRPPSHERKIGPGHSLQGTLYQDPSGSPRDKGSHRVARRRCPQCVLSKYTTFTSTLETENGEQKALLPLPLGRAQTHPFSSSEAAPQGLKRHRRGSVGVGLSRPSPNRVHLSCSLPSLSSGHSPVYPESPS